MIVFEMGLIVAVHPRCRLPIKEQEISARIARRIG